ncbi:ATPase, T2SS/T4P/T4SS family [bacterium endosymbiont of Bathymodiolus sp. 5 South]|jgi:Tfp pilus assembly pilus retraction ATPase PilT|uniref:ATPase, T2SS/T4P/T4SS family n=1 Tax=bacterium endosymbiont of Bathymodiolus sp. 5 South TaxID=1181670 RepID=UPI0010B94EE0|nr:ATPase, T2SS/T4P/T4SS family [bacterium endosymbiont of Bathymodiolus sp. 5 South]VVH58601.1 hypothetical protein BSPCLSOX_1302 [uncultured Gammaproteobacteria bacterium]SHN92223.1 hypothetical protein BCLUESOX_2393 [bacterium endosymbiont of Bathymodiolus sp. 5 South]SSC07917.1 Twitching motility protein PilT [bacterium endosymbiont of Bathymodiolus sp. 5 South]VVH61331.1 hypothetical protein BSPWISOX_1077 [uncultured Gammaproteobacteria bacterium]VVM25713.1 hypothetical protein BSPWISOXPB
MINNIYLTKTGCFGYTDQQLALDNTFYLSYDLVESWVKKYQLQEAQTKDFTEELKGVRYRVHLFCSKRGWNAALRLLPSKILSFDELGVSSDDVLSVCRGTGLTLFCGPTGAGKSTTMNTVIDSLLNSGELGVTITIEDPVEYLHHKDMIFQREVGTKVKDFKTGLVDAVRANPTTIVIGEIRDAETALEAVRAGLNGHRVLATLHASSIKESISRLWAFLDEQGDELLVQSLQGIVAQHLIHITDKKKYCLYESLEVDGKVKNILNQVLNHNSQLTLNACDLRQKNRTTLVEKKQKLIIDGIDETLLNCIRK